MDHKEHVVEVVRYPAGEPADRLELLSLQQLALGFLAPADVSDGGRYEDPFGALERTEHDLDRELRAVLAQAYELNAGPHLLCHSVGRRSQIIGDQAFRETLGDDVRDWLRDKFVPLVPELPFGLEVQQDYVAGLIHNDHGIGSGFQQAAISGLRPGAVVVLAQPHHRVLVGRVPIRCGRRGSQLPATSAPGRTTRCYQCIEPRPLYLTHTVRRETRWSARALLVRMDSLRRGDQARPGYATRCRSRRPSTQPSRVRRQVPANGGPLS